MTTTDDSAALLITQLSEIQQAVPKLNLSGLKRAALTTLPIICIHLCFGTYAWHHLLNDGQTLSESFYFAVVTFLTIGYGDISPHSDGAKVFFMVFIVLSLVVQLTTVTYFISAAIDMDAPNPAGSEVAEEHVAAFLKIKPRLFCAGYCFLLLLVLITAGAALLHAVNGSTWLDSFYWALTTLSTVGYGDVVPDSHHVLFALFFLAFVVIFEYLLGLIVSITVEVIQIRRLAAFFRRGLTPDMIRRMDVSADGKVSRWEFLTFMLQEMDLVDEQHLKTVLNMFDALDLDSDGKLTLRDISVQQVTGAYETA